MLAFNLKERRVLSVISLVTANGLMLASATAANVATLASLTNETVSTALRKGFRTTVTLINEKTAVLSSLVTLP